ncbi:MAG TPA: single-stranded DNA-binding protein [Bacteroidales bacterium]|nr:single-stranded DNA-binding protein [Bacteroidales bacterium]HPR57863.1 single-stranded DNA-binding protein [Bacteroidales bacterium]
MAGINKAILIGNLGRDPEIMTFENNVKKATFSLATTESYRDKEGNRVDQTEWHNIVLWRGLAEIAEKYLRKGSSIYLEGKIKTRSYEQNGVKKYVTEIFGDNLQMLGKRDQEGTSYQSQSHSEPTIEETQPTEDTTTDDLPF